MKKKAIVMIAVIAVSVVSVLAVFGLNKQFRLKDEKLIAADIVLSKVFSNEDSKDVFDVKIKELTGYFKANGINTAIISLNEEEGLTGNFDGYPKVFTADSIYRDGDILLSLKKPLEKADIQTILKLDCSGFDTEHIMDIVAQSGEKYGVAGFLFENFNMLTQDLKALKEEMNKGFADYIFGISTEDIENTKALQNVGIIDFWKFENIDNNDYKHLKGTEFANSDILLSYDSLSFESDLFILSNFNSIDGAVVTEYTAPDKDISYTMSLMDTSVYLERYNLTADNAFTVTSPSKNITSYNKGIFVAGIATPNEPVYINGNEAAMGADGSFGLYIEFSEGENPITVTQGDSTITRTVTKKTYEYTGGGSKMQFDETQRAYKGQLVQTVGDLTSILSDPDNDGAIIDGVPAGVQLVVKESVKTVRSGKYTWAYELANGGYILASKVEWIDKFDYIQAELKDIAVTKLDDGNEYLNVTLTGKPAITSAFGDDELKFTFVDTKLNQDFINECLGEDAYKFIEYLEYPLPVDSKFVSSATMYMEDGNTILKFITDTEDVLWGYNTEYGENDTVNIYLKKSPKKQAGAKPLSGVTVMLDAGHGGKDPGALAMGGVNGPNENTINLALAQATKQCFEKLGATVYLTRSDETFLTLEQRRSLVGQLKPDLFIAQHHNSLDYSIDINKHSGVESYYFTPQSATLAEIMASKISAATDRDYRGYGYGYFYVLRNDICPGVLNEYGFIINPTEYSKLYNDEDIYKAAFATVQSVLEIIPE